MAAIVRMPEVLANVTEAALQTWLVEVGASIEVGQPIAEIETEKAVVEYASELSGLVARRLIEPGDNVPVGAPIAVITAAGEGEEEIDAILRADGISASAPSSTGEPAGTAAPHPDRIAVSTSAPVDAAASTAVVVPAQGHAGPRRRFASPIVRRIARERGLDLERLTGSGPGGRIVRRDLERIETPVPVTASPVPGSDAPTAPSGPDRAIVSPDGYTDVPHTGMRRAIARRLTESTSTVPHFTLTARCRVDRLLELRRSINAVASRGISVNDLVIKAVASALRDVPAANAVWGADAIRRFDHVDLAVAVSTDGGLLTPVLRSVDTMSLTAVSETIAEMAERARAGRLRQHELEGGSFSVSNLGMYGVDSFAAIINPPHAGILAVGAATQQPVVDDGVLAVGTVMTVTLSADHRVLDGAVGAAWLAAFVRRIEDPLSILV